MGGCSRSAATLTARRRNRSVSRPITRPASRRHRRVRRTLARAYGSRAARRRELRGGRASPSTPGLFHQTGKIPKRQGTLHWTRRSASAAAVTAGMHHAGRLTSLIEWVKSDGLGADNPMSPRCRTRCTPGGRSHLAVLTPGRSVTRWRSCTRVPSCGALYAAVRAPEALLSDAHLADRGFSSRSSIPGPGRPGRFPRAFGSGRAGHVGPPPADEHRSAVARLVRHLMRCTLRPRADFGATSVGSDVPILVLSNVSTTRPSCSPPHPLFLRRAERPRFARQRPHSAPARGCHHARPWQRLPVRRRRGDPRPRARAVRERSSAVPRAVPSAISSKRAGAGIR
jgi:hypothetical protein